MSAKNQRLSYQFMYMYVSESSRFALLENGIGYYAMTQSLEVLAFEAAEFS